MQMSVTIADLLKLPCLEDATVKAGSNGLKNIVSSVSVLEYSEPTHVQNLFFEKNKVFLGGELVITGFVNIKDDVGAQCESIRRIHAAGDVGLIIYYVGIILPKIDQKVLDTANRLNFPVICMPKNRIDLRYSEVISDVVEAIIRDQRQEKYFVGEMLERISSMPAYQRKVENVLRMISDRIHCTLIITDRQYAILQRAAWPMSATEHLEEAVQVYRTDQDHSREKVTLSSGRQIYMDSRSILSDHHVTLYLLVVSERTIDKEQVDQSTEVIRLFINIWNNQEGHIGTTELVHAIIKDEPVKMRRLAEIMHVNVASFHTVWVIFARNRAPSENQDSVNLALLSAVKTFFGQQKIHFVADIFENRVLVFFEDLKFMDQLHSQAEAFIQEIRDDAHPAVLFYQTGLENTTNVRNTYTLLNLHLKDIFAIYPRKDILTYQELLFTKDCAEMIGRGEEKVQETLAPIVPILADENGETLIKTLTVYLLDVQMSIAKTADRLYVHRNTVKYRLRRIDELLNYNIRKLPENYWVYVAVAARRLLRKG